MDYRIELRDRSFNLLEVLEKDAFGISWEYNRIGGCGNFAFILARKFDDPKALSGFYDVRIYKRTAAGTHTLWHSGYVEEKRPTLKNKEDISVRGIGYVQQLKDVVVNTTYTNTEISAIVKDILDNYVVPNTDITYDAGDLVDTGFTADSLEFKTDAYRAMETLAEIVGTREWGVGSDRKFFFKARTDTISFYFPIESIIRGYSPVFDFRGIKNKLYLEGGDVSGTKYTRTGSNAASIAKYGTLEEIIQNSSIVTNTVADQYLEAILDEKSDLDIKAKLDLVNYLSQFESSVPLGRVEIMEVGVRYGEEYYGTFLYSDNLKYRINRILYRLKDADSALEVSLDLGKGRTSLAESIGQIEYELEQLRQGRV